VAQKKLEKPKSVSRGLEKFFVSARAESGTARRRLTESGSVEQDVAILEAALQEASAPAVRKAG
jgi:hypothetical protein